MYMELEPAATAAAAEVQQVELLEELGQARSEVRRVPPAARSSSRSHHRCSTVRP